MTDLVPSKFHASLTQYAKLYFATQQVKMDRYPLLKETKLSDLDNILISFSDGSASFAASCQLYLKSMIHSKELNF